MAEKRPKTKSRPLRFAPDGSPSIAEVRIDDVYQAASVAIGSRAGFSAIKTSTRLVVSYFALDGRLTVAYSDHGGKNWKTLKLPGSHANFDSHLAIELQEDSEGVIHLIGGSHSSQVNYFLLVPEGDSFDVSSIPESLGAWGGRFTYGMFFERYDELFLTHRFGSAGDGGQVFLVWDGATQNWGPTSHSGLLLDGEGLASPYVSRPVVGSDGVIHLSWMWRYTPEVETTFGIFYAKSPNGRDWYDHDGGKLTLPIGPETLPPILDVPVGSGLVNNNVVLGLWPDGAPIVSFIADDLAGMTQVFWAVPGPRQWVTYPMTNWAFRWSPTGRGTVPFDATLNTIDSTPERFLQQVVWSLSGGLETITAHRDGDIRFSRASGDLLVPGQLRAPYTDPHSPLRSFAQLRGRGTCFPEGITWQAPRESRDASPDEQTLPRDAGLYYVRFPQASPVGRNVDFQPGVPSEIFGNRSARSGAAESAEQTRRQATETAMKKVLDSRSRLLASERKAREEVGRYRLLADKNNPELERLRGEYEGVAAEMVRVLSERDGLLFRVEELAGRLGALEGERDGVVVELERLRSEYEGVAAGGTQLESQLESLARAHDALKKSSSDLVSRFDQQAKTLRETEKSLEVQRITNQEIRARARQISRLLTLLSERRSNKIGLGISGIFESIRGRDEERPLLRWREISVGLQSLQHLRVREEKDAGSIGTTAQSSFGRGRDETGVVKQIRSDCLSENAQTGLMRMAPLGIFEASKTQGTRTSGGRKKILVLAADLAHNPLGRALTLAEGLDRQFDVVVAGPLLDRFGGAIWGPAETYGTPVVSIGDGSIESLERAANRLCGFDLVVASKPRMTSYGLALRIRELWGTPIILDIDDYEFGFEVSSQPNGSNLGGA